MGKVDGLVDGRVVGIVPCDEKFIDDLTGSVFGFGSAVVIRRVYGMEGNGRVLLRCGTKTYCQGKNNRQIKWKFHDDLSQVSKILETPI
ncbi:MAG: hypothetical protein COA73_07165 [Candidatus Hydrogenedentota bacterium]|nr:MAG: hypothetical protein COA73_07165 [Candidatus Hydrogenedentota bacterium]